MWENYATHGELLGELFESFEVKRNYRILDAGSGRTSLYFLRSRFPHARITAIVFPGDQRKIKSIREFVPPSYYMLKEIDIINFNGKEEFDIVLAHLLLGEASKFGNTFDDVLDALFSIKTKHLVIMDVLEDPDVNYRSILRAIAMKGSIRKISCLDKYIGFLISMDKRNFSRARLRIRRDYRSANRR